MRLTPTLVHVHVMQEKSQSWYKVWECVLVDWHLLIDSIAVSLFGDICLSLTNQKQIQITI